MMYDQKEVSNYLAENIDLFTDDHLAHYGMPRRSGRYKWGSGKDPYQSAARAVGSSAKAFHKAAAREAKAAEGKLSGVAKRNAKRRENTKAAKIQKKREKEEAKEAKKEKAKKPKYRDEKAYVKSLSDEELNRINKRDAAEATYLKNHPQQKSFPKKVADMAVKDILVPAAYEVVKEQGKAYIKGKLTAEAEKLLKDQERRARSNNRNRNNNR
ncbi:MAG TPA: hypothetical protein DCW90_06875 [Lachnospiraceae bacterium]|nr:hypothetical protein [Lachnospiraceae bacterium]